MFIKIAFALIILAGLFYVVGAPALVSALAEIEFEYVIYLIIISVVMIWLSCLKWQIFVRASGHRVSVFHLMKLYTVAYFFNTFIPSYIGGDVARSYHLGRHLDSQKDAFVATFLERFTGILAMSCLGVLFVVLGSRATVGVEAAILIVGIGTLVLALMFFSKTFGDFCFAIAPRIVRNVGLPKFADKLDALLRKIGDAMVVARTDLRLLGKAMVLSFAFHIMTVVNTYVAAVAVGWKEPDFAGLFVVVPLVLLVSMVPLTPSGLGIQEGAFLFFLTRVGGTKAQGLGVGLVLRAKVMLIAALGGLLLLTLKSKSGSFAPIWKKCMVSK